MYQRIWHYIQQTKLHDIRRTTKHYKSQTTDADRRTNRDPGLVRGTQHRRNLDAGHLRGDVLPARVETGHLRPLEPGVRVDRPLRPHDRDGPLAHQAAHRAHRTAQAVLAGR